MAMAWPDCVQLRLLVAFALFQSPLEAVAPDMPTNALLKDSPDFIVGISEMPSLLAFLVTV